MLKSDDIRVAGPANGAIYRFRSKPQTAYLFDHLVGAGKYTWAQRRSIDHRGTLVRDNTDRLRCHARARQCFARCELYSATVWEFDITPDKSSATFKHLLRANRKARWQVRATEHF